MAHGPRFPLARQQLVALLETRIATARLALECADNDGAHAILAQAMAEGNNEPVGMVVFARRSMLYRELTSLFRRLGESQLANQARNAALIAGREAFRQGIRQGHSLLSSQLWPR